MTDRQATLAGMDKAMSPLPQPGFAKPLRDSAVLTAAWVATDPVSVWHARRVTLFCAYAADASGTDNVAQIRVMCSAEESTSTPGAPPTVAMDVWYAPTIVDATPTETSLASTKETGATATITSPEHAVVVARPMAITLGAAANAGTDVVRLAVTLDVSGYRWMYVAATEIGDTDAGDLGVLGIKWSMAL